jgi:hypothetical protein
VRNFGAVLMLVGVLGFFYASSRLGDVAPLGEGLSVSEGLREPAGRWEMARFACAAAAGFGLLIALFPKGR